MLEIIVDNLANHSLFFAITTLVAGWVFSLSHEKRVVRYEQLTFLDKHQFLFMSTVMGAIYLFYPALVASLRGMPGVHVVSAMLLLACWLTSMGMLLTGLFMLLLGPDQ